MNITGRVARLCNQFTKPSLNGTYVVIVSSRKDKHEVQTLETPNDTESGVSLYVTADKLQMLSEDTFHACFPRAIVLPLDVEEEVQERSMYDVSTRTSAKRLVISRSALVRGKAVPFKSVENVHPTTSASFEVMVLDLRDVSVIEFENIQFSRNVACASGTNITFRKCRFSNVNIGVNVGTGLGSAHVVFESCLFEDISLVAVKVNKNSHAEFRNCVFRNTGTAVKLAQGGRVEMVHCTIEGVKKCAIYAVKGEVRLMMINCLIRNVKENGVTLVGSNNTLDMQGCRIEKCTDKAVLIEGPKFVYVQIADCVFTECWAGLNMSRGRYHADIRNTVISRCPAHGVYLPYTTIGKIAFTNCDFSQAATEPVANCMNLTSRLCEVVVNGVLQTPEQDETGYRLVQPKQVFAKLVDVRVVEVKVSGAGRKQSAQQMKIARVLSNKVPFV